ncbi:MAG: hypothetical protein PW792_16845 [Acidobacteriaceae bacterium]|nr:hypothetical protein [Acidobacteriaceae bacterium]
MWPLLRLLFSSNYWRLMRRGQFWRDTRRAFRRAHKDPRAWRQFAKALYLLLLPFSVVIFAAGIAAVAAGSAGFVFIWFFIGLMALLSRLGFGKQETKQPDTVTSLSITSTESEPSPPNDELRRELGELCLLHAVFADRAASERFVQTKELPEGYEVVSRRRHIDLLREHGLYDRLRGTERTLLLMPQGHWPQDVIDGCSMALETLRLLQWVVRMDGYLALVGEHLEADFSLSRSVLDAPDVVFAHHGFVKVKDLETAIHAAAVLAYRCWAEGVYRGYYKPDDAEKEQELRDHALRFAGKEGEDFLLGNQIVSQAAEPDVRLATTLAYRRQWVLNWVQRRWKGVEEPLENMQLFYCPNLPNAPEDE